MENFRRSIGLRIRETKEVYEGEVTELTPVEVEHPTVSGYGKTISNVVIGLKTAKGTKQLKLDPSIYESLQKEKVEVGDVIYIEANSGAVKRQGRSDTFATEFDLEVSNSLILFARQSTDGLLFDFILILDRGIRAVTERRCTQEEGSYTRCYFA